MVCASPTLLVSVSSNKIHRLTEVCQLHAGIELMCSLIRSGKEHVLRFYIHMHNAVPSTPVGRLLVGPIAAIAKGVYHGVEDMPQKSFWKNEPICAPVNDEYNKHIIRWNLYRCV